MTTAGPDGRIIEADRRSALMGGRRVRWTRRMKATFLDHLAATCNVRASAAAIGVEPVSVYALRRNDPRFAAAWGEAVKAGYEMLETQLIGHALDGGGPTITNGDPDRIGPIDRDLALRLLNFRREAMLGRTPAPGGPRRARATAAETDAAILRKLAAIARKKESQR